MPPQDAALGQRTADTLSANVTIPPLSVSANGDRAQDELRPRLDFKLTAWKQRLLDISKRNRALNFKVQKVSTIAIVDEQPAEVFRRICLKGGSMRFQPTLPSKDATAARESGAAEAMSQPWATTAEFLSDDDDVDGGLGLEFAPYDPEQLDTHYTDDILQCAATPESLDKSLRRLDEQARSAIEEQGVNTLYLALGMLEYRESSDSEQTFRAPIVLVPAALSRKSARSGYTLSAADEDPIVNPSLAEYLRVTFAITIPDLPDLTEGTDYDLQELLTEVSQAIEGRSGWRVTTDIYLGLFAFQKLVMYKDLEKNLDAFGVHRLIRQLVTRDGSNIIGLPADIRDMQLDREFTPEDTYQVVDADSSQARAIAAVAKQHDLVLEGPPGTGKSQTITNLIGQALASGKSVLFVAEKMAALQVVHSRLMKAGLGEFCLELHSTKANKRAVMQELRNSLDASLQRPQGMPSSSERLKRVRATLNEYVRAVHAPAGALGLSPFRAYGELGEVLDAPRLSFSADEQQPTQGALDDIVRSLDELAVAALPVGNVAEHPWRDATKPFYGEATLDEIARTAADVAARFARFQELARAVERAFAVPPIRTAADVEVAASVARVLERSPGAPLPVLESSAWNAPPPEATAFVARGRKAAQLRAKIAEQFTVDVVDQDHASDIAYVEHKSQGLFAFLAFLDGRYRSIKRRWRTYRLPRYQKPLIDQAADLKRVQEYRAERDRLEQAASQGRELFGALWQGERSDWDTLDRYIQWVVEFRTVCIRHGLAHHALEVASQPKPDVGKILELQRLTTSMLATLENLRQLVGWPEGYYDSAMKGDIAATSSRVAALAGAIALAPRWAAFEQARAKLDGTAAESMVRAAMRNEVAFGDLSRAFKRAFYQKWLERVVIERPLLREFSTLSHEQRVAEFRQLDERVLMENRVSVVGQLREEVQRKLLETDAASGMPFLRSEMARQRNLSPLRKTLQYAEGAVRAIKPCFLMSPLTVAQYLDGSKPSFDLVVFDEASQLTSEEAVGAIARGRQLVVVGDPKQLPPTNFFAAAVTDAPAPPDDSGAPQIVDAESVLEEFMGVGVPVTRLKWHYRSAHESLITFSNVSFYDADLYTFPSVQTTSEEYGLHFDYVADGVYEGKGLNMAEARRVVDAVIEHARTRPDESLGVGTFNLRQQIAIQDELELRRRQDPSVEPFFDKAKPEPFFVKNLENIQGDERDVIYLSVTYAKGPDGRLRYNFGPINGQNGWRRLNVLTTRARKRMRVFSSMKGDEISPANAASEGPRLLREFLLYAERGRLESTLANARAGTESPLERDVLTEIVRRGYLVDPQVGVAGYRIDLGVRDPAVPGRYICGIECDGVAYHASETARDRDRLRQQVLEGRGWTIVRVWSTDWFKDRAGQIERLVAAIENAKKNAVEEREAEAEARAREAEERARQEAERLERGLDTSSNSPALRGGVYVRPEAASYRMAPGQGKYAGGDVLAVPLSHLAAEVVSVIEAESPVHAADVKSRVAAMWGSRLGSRIADRLGDACNAALRGDTIERRGEFFWKSGANCVARSRSGTRIPADRVAPEEYEAAIRLVLRAAGSLTREELLTEVRAVLGLGRAAVAEERYDEVVSAMLERRVLGEGSAGLVMRE